MKQYIPTFDEFLNESFHTPDGTPIGVDHMHRPISTNEAEVNELLKVEMAKVEEFVDKLLSKIKNSKLATEIRKFAALQKIDPSSNYSEIIDNIKWKFGREPELRNPEIQRLLATI
jgi:hypothetical protein